MGRVYFRRCVEEATAAQTHAGAVALHHLAILPSILACGFSESAIAICVARVTFGRMYRLLFSLFLLLGTLGACDDNDEAPAGTAIVTPPPTTDTTTAGVTYLALGDSYTIGEGVSFRKTFPYQLFDSLQARGFTQANIQVIATSGWRSDELLHAVDETDIVARPNLVTLLIGVNDQFQGRATNEFRQDFLRLLGRAERLAVGGRDDIIVVTIPDYSATPFAMTRDTAADRRALDVFNAVVREEAGARGLPVVDVTTVSKAARARPGELLAADELHPSGTQYSLWIREMLPAVLAVVAE